MSRDQEQALRAEIDELRQKVLDAKNGVAMSEAAANEAHRLAQMTGERDRLKAELASITSTGIVGAPPEAVAVVDGVVVNPAVIPAVSGDLQTGEVVTSDTPVDDTPPVDTRANRPRQN